VGGGAIGREGLKSRSQKALISWLLNIRMLEQSAHCEEAPGKK